MGARGPLKLPPQLRAVKPGDELDEPLTAASAVPLVAPNKPPAVAEHAEMSALWDEIVPELDKAGLVTTSDAPAIELALRHFLLARLAHGKIGQDVIVDDKNHGGVKKNPAEAVFRAESEMFLRYADKLGMTFAARARTALGQADPDDNPYR